MPDSTVTRNKTRIDLLTNALKNRAIIYELVGEYGKAIRDYDRAKSCSTRSFRRQNPFLFAEMAVNQAAIVEHHEQNFAKARALIARILKKHGNKNRTLFVQILRTLGNIFERRGQYGLALHYYKKVTPAVRGLKRKNRGIELGISYNNLGVVYHDLGRIDSAEKFYRKALGIFRRIRDRRRAGIVCNNLGIINFDKGRFGTALSYYNKYLEIAEKIGYKKGVSTAVGNIGLIHHCMNELDEAMRNYQHHYSISEELGDRWEMSVALANIGSVYYDKGNYGTASRFYQRCKTISKKIGNKGTSGLAALGLGLAYTEMNRIANALAMIRIAKRIFLEMKDPIKLSEVYAGFARIYMLRGDHCRSVRCAKKSLLFADRAKAKEQKITALRTLAMVCHERAMKMKRYAHNKEIARTYLRKSIRLARKHMMYVELAKSLTLGRELSAVYRSSPRQ